MRTNKASNAARNLCRVALAMVVAVVAGCGDGQPTAQPSTAPPPSAAPASPSVDPSVAAASAQILAAYNGYQLAFQAAGKVPDPQNADLSRYVGDPLLSQVRQDLTLLKVNGLVRKGAPKTHPEITELQLGATPPVGVIRDCYDVSGVHVVNRATGRSADAPRQATRYVVTSQAKYFGGQRGWLIVTSDADRNRPC
jgi:hypothetical protein